MKKLVAIILTVVMALGMMAACAEPMLGGWSVSENTEITDEQKALFDKAMEGLLGVNYEPIAFLGSQVVSGTNYCFLCRATVVYPGATVQLALVYIYENLEGATEVTNIVTLDLGELSAEVME